MVPIFKCPKLQPSIIWGRFVLRLTGQDVLASGPQSRAVGFRVRIQDLVLRVWGVVFRISGFRPGVW